MILTETQKCSARIGLFTFFSFVSVFAAAGQNPEVLLELSMARDGVSGKLSVTSRDSQIEVAGVGSETYFPTLESVLVDDADHVFVIERGQRFIRVFKDGKIVSNFSKGFAKPQKFTYSLDGDGNLLVVGHLEKMARVFDFAGNLKLEFEIKAFLPDQLEMDGGFVLDGTSGAAISKVTEQGGNPPKRLRRKSINLNFETSNESGKVKATGEGLSVSLPLMLDQYLFADVVGTDALERLYVAYSRSVDEGNTLLFKCVVFGTRSGTRELARLDFLPMHIRRSGNGVIQIKSKGNVVQVLNWRI